jgi:hypothetical protein
MFKDEIEAGLNLGLRSGKDARQMASDLKTFLRFPEKRFRRTRDEYGDLQPSQDASLYHPGRGVYRSSYKNALRLTATETNMAYRKSDHERWQQLNFVVGQEVHCSETNHPVEDICDFLAGKYPKDFVFVGWHPFCRCYVTPVLKTETEIEEDSTRIIAGKNPLPSTKSENAVADLPLSFQEHVQKNGERIANTTSSGLPYFIQDNRKRVDKLLGLDSNVELTPQELAAKRHAARSPQEIADTKARWEKRVFANEKIRRDADRVLTLAKAYSEVDYAQLEKLIAQSKLAEMDAETQKVLQALKDMREQERAIQDLIPDAHQLHKQFSIEVLQEAHRAITKTFNRWQWDCTNETSLSLIKGNLEAEIDAVTKLGSSTQGIIKKVYEQKLAFVDSRLTLLKFDTQYNELLGFKTQSKEFFEYMSIAKDAMAAGDTHKAQLWLNAAADKKLQIESVKAKKALAVASKEVQVGTKVGPTSTKAVQKSTKIAPTTAQTSHAVQTDHPTIRGSKERKIAQIKEMLNCTDERAKAFYNAANGFSNGWDWEIRQVQCGNMKFTSKSGHSLSRIEKKARDLEEFIRKSPQWAGGTTYRGMSLSDKDLTDVLGKLKNGTFDNQGSASWTTNHTTAFKYSLRHIGEVSDAFGDDKTNRVIMILKKQKHATSIRHLSDYPEEFEVLASKDCRYRLVGKEIKGTGSQKVVYLTVEAI